MIRNISGINEAAYSIVVKGLPKQTTEDETDNGKEIKETEMKIVKVG